MGEAKKIDIDKYRLEFAERIQALIELEKGTKKLEEFSKRSGQPDTRLSQWRSPKHRNWPSVANLIELCANADISPAWLLFGKGPQSLREVDDNALVVELLQAEGVEETGKLHLRERAIRTLEKKLKEIREIRSDGDVLQPDHRDAQKAPGPKSR